MVNTRWPPKYQVTRLSKTVLYIKKRLFYIKTLKAGCHFVFVRFSSGLDHCNAMALIHLDFECSVSEPPLSLHSGDLKNFLVQYLNGH